jgi:hypothetical protein
MRQDCTHWCAPGLSDAVGSLLVSLITLYDGNRTKFVEAMVRAKTSEGKDEEKDTKDPKHHALERPVLLSSQPNAKL